MNSRATQSRQPDKFDRLFNQAMRIDDESSNLIVYSNAPALKAVEGKITSQQAFERYVNLEVSKGEKKIEELGVKLREAEMFRKAHAKFIEEEAKRESDVKEEDLALVLAILDREERAFMKVYRSLKKRYDESIVAIEQIRADYETAREERRRTRGL